MLIAVDFEKTIVWIKWIGTHQDYDRLDVLATLIDACESQHYPVDPPPPRPA